ncbi:DMT family transporter [Nocardioides baculatus]|uniref:DMT family transporter n=1 Tax=Nocardioides baculatus TaxID=2801337 RepID=A0ABS1L6A7_9ACTN|nr:DMT family transporter [Nocardioides baculatus]MBL0747224.1 DMT family transporter [Nocardioides baculatus]
MRTRLLVTALLIVAWGSTFTSLKVALEGCPPLVLAATRCLVGGALLALVAGASRRPLRLRGNLGPYAALTLLNVVGFFGLQVLAIDHLDSGYASLLLYLQPVVTVLLARPLLGDPLGPARVLGALTAFAGVAVVSLRHEGEVSSYGVALGVATAVCWSLGTITVKRTAARVEPLWAVALPLVAGGALLAVAAALTGTDGLDLTPTVGIGVVWTTLVGTALAWLLWMHLVTTGEVGRVAVSIFLVPVVAVLLGWALLDEQLGWPLAAGTLLVCAGVYAVNRWPGRRATEPLS